MLPDVAEALAKAGEYATTATVYDHLKPSSGLDWMDVETDLHAAALDGQVTRGSVHDGNVWTITEAGRGVIPRRTKGRAKK